MPEPWQTSAAGPFITMKRERGTVTVEALGQERFVVGATGEDQVRIEGYNPAVQLARELATKLGPAV